MSLYSILLSTMHPNNTPPFDLSFQDPQSDYTSVPSYNNAMLSDDLGQTGFAPAGDPYASPSGPAPVSSSAQYLDQSTSTWPQGYAHYGSQQPQFVQSTAVPAHQWQHTGYPQASHLHGQTYSPGLPAQQSSTSIGYYGANMPVVHNTTPAQYPAEIPIGQSHPGQWSAAAMGSSGSAVGLQQGTHLGSPQRSSFTNVPTSSYHRDSSGQTAATGQRRSSSSPTTPTTPVRRRSPADTHRSGNAPDTRPSPSRQPRSSSQTPCCWGGFCGTSLDTLPIAAISHHLKEAHIDRHAWDGRARVVCQWTSGGTPCGMEMYYDNIGKHIAAVHLGSTALSCPYCDKSFSRGDSLCRHVREACRHATE
ncbi:hypothetical protein DAEQUDRAFT_815410 [Daedalea quercina L-15889]|uniref:C2H2-type domain-containing protein n=1 Tax=Daedalea quercina L-15889 TaxID=1314783 RepID=A0A165L0J9_9APHY|nr:hypothetical protein DAEQUDRAFT_815410 [Daedalea quercina L-15889]